MRLPRMFLSELYNFAIFGLALRLHLHHPDNIHVKSHCMLTNLYPLNLIRLFVVSYYLSFFSPHV